MHLKRMKSSTKWPISRKGNKFVVRPLGELNNSIPLLIILRDMLKIGRDRSEIKQILNKGEIEVNGKTKKEAKLAVKAFDVIGVKSLNKTYSLIINQFRRFELVEKKDNNRISKIIGKRMLKEGKMQVNLMSGDNFIMNDDVVVGDSVVVNKENKVQKVIPLKNGSKVIVVKGKHIGEEGTVKEIVEDVAKVVIEKKESDIKLDNLMAI